MPPEYHVRMANIRPSTLDEQNRSVEVVLATEDPIVSTDLRTGEAFLEVLRMDGAEIPEQIPLLDTHERKSVRATMGSIRSIRVDGDQMVGRLFVSTAEERIWTKIKERHIRDVSVGSDALETTAVQPGSRRVINGKTYEAPPDTSVVITTRWRPAEGSLTWKGSDPRATIRSEKDINAMNETLRKHLETIGLAAGASDAEAQAFFDNLAPDARATASAAAAEPPATPPPADPPPADPPVGASGRNYSSEPRPQGDAIRTAIAAERERVRLITELAGSDVPDTVRQHAIERGLTIEQASQVFLGAVRTTRQAHGNGSGPGIHVRDHDRDCTVRSLAAGMLADQGLEPTNHALYRGVLPRRADRLTEQDAELGESFRGMSAPDIFRECLRIDTGRSYRTIGEALEAVRATPSGATLSHVFTTNVYARLVAGWETAGDTTAGWCDEEDVANFMEHEDITTSGSSRLEGLPRGGTATHATFSDKKEVYRIARYAKKFTVDEQDIIDDRLGAIMRVPGDMGEAAARLRPDLVYSLMLENPTMTDTGAVFNATATTTAGGHANLGTGALASATLMAAISAMGVQRDANNSILNIEPRYLIVPSALDWTAQSLLSPASIAHLFADSADPVRTTENLIARKRLLPVMDDRIGAVGVVDPRTGLVRTGSATNWFMAAGGSRSLRVAYLRGTGRRPVLRSYTLDKGQWGIGWDINMDIGAGFMDFRPWYKSTGAG